MEVYLDDFNESVLRQIYNFKYSNATTRGDHSLSHITNFLKSLSPIQRGLTSEVRTSVNLVLVIPATNVVSGRRASGLRRVKSSSINDTAMP